MLRNPILRRNLVLLGDAHKLVSMVLARPEHILHYTIDRIGSLELAILDLGRQVLEQRNDRKKIHDTILSCAEAVQYMCRLLHPPQSALINLYPADVPRHSYHISR